MFKSVKAVRVSPSIIAIDYKNEAVLNETLSKLEKSLASFIHLDVMDGKFVKNTTFDARFVEEIKNKTNLLLDVHLMVENPDAVLDDYISAGADILSVHIEACKNIEKTLKYIKLNGCLAGVAISPSTPVDVVKPLIDKDLVDVVVVMSVEPGAYGQKFIPESAQKVSEIRDMDRSIEIEVDGGINIRNARMLKKLGATILVSGATIFQAEDINLVIKQLKLKDELIPRKLRATRI